MNGFFEKYFYLLIRGEMPSFFGGSFLTTA